MWGGRFGVTRGGDGARGGRVRAGQAALLRVVPVNVVYMRIIVFSDAWAGFKPAPTGVG